MQKLKVLLLGKSGRLDAMAEAIWRSPRLASLHILSEVSNPGLRSHSTSVRVGDSADPNEVVAFANEVRPDFAVIGPEEPLAAGVVDALARIGIPSVGPTKDLARIESSKIFARELIEQLSIHANPIHRVFHNENGLRSYLASLQGFVVKPDGLTGGKGVRVSGDHFHSSNEAEAYCREIFADGGVVLIEEKLDGEEFSFQSFCDGISIVDMIPVQDHKRLNDGDTGPNTGGMGSYTCADHSLPFLTNEDLIAASEINRRVFEALNRTCEGQYKGILYGGFIATSDGVKVIEYNARFGDPEALNILPLLETEFLDICEAIVNGTLDELAVRFRRKASVCKYVVPNGYPSAGVSREPVGIPVQASDVLKIYQGAVTDGSNGRLELTGSRAIGIVGIGDTVVEAEEIAEAAAASISGLVYHRRDIGSTELIQKRVNHMQCLRGGTVVENYVGDRAWATVA